jgi:hypothetical protein
VNMSCSVLLRKEEDREMKKTCKREEDIIKSRKNKKECRYSPVGRDYIGKKMNENYTTILEMCFSGLSN